MSDISSEDGAKITKEARSWKGTPYKLVGASSTKGGNGGADCSGSTWRICCAAGFEYRVPSHFNFREVRG